MKAQLEDLSPTYFGYEIDNDNQSLQPVMMTQSVAAPELLNDMVCACNGVCDEECTCFLNEQPCTAACSCMAGASERDINETGCTNPYTLVNLLEEDADNESDSGSRNM